MKSPFFTPDEDRELTRLWALGTPVKIIAYRLGRPSAQSIKERAKRLSLPAHPWMWTAAQITALTALRAQRVPHKLIAEKLSTPAKKITAGAIRNQILKQRLPAAVSP